MVPRFTYLAVSAGHLLLAAAPLLWPGSDQFEDNPRAIGREIEPNDVTGRRFRFSWIWNVDVPGKPEFERFAAADLEEAQEESIPVDGATGDAGESAADRTRDPEESEAAISELIRELGSPSQETRDAAAEKLRQSYVPPKRDRWMKLLAGIKPGDGKKEVLQQIAIHPLKLEIGDGP